MGSSEMHGAGERATTLAELPRIHGRQRGSATALVYGERTTSFAELDRASSRVAQALRAAGVEPGTRLGVVARDSDHAIELLFGAAKVGAVVLGVNWRLAEPEIRFILEDAGAELLFVDPTLAEKAAGAVDGLASIRARLCLDGSADGYETYSSWRDAHGDEDPGHAPDPEDLAVLMYTSGTTGLPKGVMLPHRSFFAVVRSLREHGDPWIGWSDADVSLHNIPLFHIGGLWWAATSLDAGATLVVLDAFDAPRALDAIERHRVTKLCMVPAMIQMMLVEPACKRTELSSLDCIAYGGSPIPAPLLAAGLETFGCDFAQIYGLTETGNTAVCLRPDQHRDPSSERLKAAGKPYPGVRLEVIGADGAALPAREVGEIKIHSPANMLGYLNRPEATAETLRDGWVHTGDAGYLDEDGYVYVHDRIKDMIIYAGENVYPAEIESVLCAHAAVREAAVIGIPDERWGEQVKAVVVLEPGARVKAREILAHCRGKIADFKVPQSVDFADALPRTPSGKIQKAVLRAPYWEGRERQVH